MERELSSSDDDEEEGGDHRTLVPQNETKPNHNHRHFPTFEIGDLPSRFRRGFWGGGKKYLLLILLPLFLFLVLYFSLSLDLRSLFHGVSILPAANSPSDRMREAELHALFLLKSQQSALLTIWNQTLATGSNSTTSNSTSDDFRSAIFDQIKLNKQIQKALLSSHRSGNSSEEGFDDNVGDEVFSNGIDLCRKVDLAAERRTIEWNPKKDRYLFAVCLSGQMSNHLICLEKHMFFAALLDRVLIFPSHKVDYKYDEVLDIENINKCFGKKVVIPFDEFAEMKKNKMRIDRFICYTASPPCYLDEEHIKRLKALGISLGKIEAAWPEDAKVKIHKKRVVGDITPKFTSDEEVIAVGDLFYANVEEEWVMQPGGPLAHKCKTVIQPSRLIVLTAQRFVQTFLGSNFIALHFRRHGFLKFCNVKEESCFFPIPQAAECILRVVGRANAPIIYLSTDAAESETDLLQSLLVLNDAKAVPLVKRPSHTSVEKWDALLYRNQLGGNSQVEAMLDKTISAMSNVFIGAPGSTFTEDILRLRRGWGSASRCDEYLCRGELPNFIAEND